MSEWLVLLAYVAAVNPARLRPGLTAGEEPGELGQLVGGVALVAAAGLVLVLAADGILDVLDITDETWRLAAGVVCGFAGVRALVGPGLEEMPRLGGGALVPISYPLLFSPQLAVLAIVFGATETFALAWGGLVLALGIGAAGGLLRHRRPVLWGATGRLIGAALVVVAVALIVAGIRDV